MHLLNRYNQLCIYGYCFKRSHLLHSHLCCTCSFWYHSQEHKERESYALLCSLELNSRGEYHSKWNGWRIRNAMRKTHLDRHSYCKINSYWHSIYLCHQVQCKPEFFFRSRLRKTSTTGWENSIQEKCELTSSWMVPIPVLQLYGTCSSGKSYLHRLLTWPRRFLLSS